MRKFARMMLLGSTTLVMVATTTMHKIVQTSRKLPRPAALAVAATPFQVGRYTCPKYLISCSTKWMNGVKPTMNLRTSAKSTQTASAISPVSLSAALTFT